MRVVTSSRPTISATPDNYIPANPLATPAQIVPEWYFWPFYAILRSFTIDFILPAKLWGVLAMFALDPPAVLPAVARQVAGPLGRLPAVVQALLLVAGRRRILLGWAGGGAPKALPQCIGQVAAAYYFLHFLVILPLVSRFETTLPLPNSITEGVLHGEAAEAAPAGQTKLAAARQRR